MFLLCVDINGNKYDCKYYRGIAMTYNPRTYQYGFLTIFQYYSINIFVVIIIIILHIVGL